MTWKRDEIKAKLAELAVKGVFIGTSSWKYPGWCDLLYDEQRYFSRLKKFSKAKFDKECLAEYAEVFKTVGFDGAYYRFPSVGY